MNKRTNLSTGVDDFANHLPAANLAVISSDRRRFKRFRAALLAELDPRTVTEHIVAEQIVTHRWFLAQYDAALAAAMRAAVYVQHNPPLTVSDAFTPAAAKLKGKLADANVPPNRADRQDAEHAQAVAAAQLEKIYKYRKEHERGLDRALAEWKTLLAARPVPDPPEDRTRRGGKKRTQRARSPRSAERLAKTRNERKSPEPSRAAAPTPSLSMKVPLAGSQITVKESRTNKVATKSPRSGGAAGLRRENADRPVGVPANEAERQHRSSLKLFAGQQRNRAGPSPARSARGDALRSAQSRSSAQIRRHRRGGELRGRLSTAAGLPDRAGRKQRPDQAHLPHRSARGRVRSLPCPLPYWLGSGL